jgi:hypothetical protein
VKHWITKCNDVGRELFHEFFVSDGRVAGDTQFVVESAEVDLPRGGTSREHDGATFTRLSPLKQA